MATEGIGEPPPPEVLAEIQAVIAKAKAGDASVLPQLRAILDQSPELSRHFGDLARHAEAAWIALAAGNNAYLRETITRAAEAQRAELTRPGATPIEQILVGRVVACGLQLNYLTAAEANALGAGDSYRLLDYQAKRIERAQRLYLSAMAALVSFQRLVPVVQAVAQSTNHVLPVQQQDERIDNSRPEARAAVAVQRVNEDVEPDDAQREVRERLRVGVTN